MSHICEEYAKSLGVRVGRPKISDHFFPIPFDQYITIQTTSKFESRNYSFWDSALSLIKERLPQYKVVQVGVKGDPLCLRADSSLLEATSFRQMFHVIKNSSLHLGVDSLGVHVASALDIPCVGLYSNMLSSQSGPLWHKNSDFTCINSDKKNNKPSYATVERSQNYKYYKTGGCRKFSTRTHWGLSRLGRLQNPPLRPSLPQPNSRGYTQLSSAT